MGVGLAGSPRQWFSATPYWALDGAVKELRRIGVDPHEKYRDPTLSDVDTDDANEKQSSASKPMWLAALTSLLSDILLADIIPGVEVAGKRPNVAYGAHI